MIGIGRRAALVICAVCAVGLAPWRSAMAISTLSDTLKDIPKIVRTPSTEPPNNAVHRDFGVQSRRLHKHLELYNQDLGPGPQEEPDVIPPAAAPWVVAIGDGPHLNRDFLCAGALVAPNWVLTAAHCTYNLVRRWPNDDGAYVFENAGALSESGLRFPVREIVPHPDYNPRTLQNDLALIRFVTDGKSKNVPIPLDGMSLSQQVGAIGSIVGWGINTEQAARNHKERLHVVQTTVLEDQICFSAANYPHLSGTHVFCGRSLLKYHDTCFRYGGSPIVFFDRKASLYLGGLVSWPAACREKRGKLDVYLDVQAYVPWIRRTIAERAKQVAQ